MIPYLKNTFRTQQERSSLSEVRNVRTPRYVLSYPAQPQHLKREEEIYG